MLRSPFATSGFHSLGEDALVEKESKSRADTITYDEYWDDNRERRCNIGRRLACIGDAHELQTSDEMLPAWMRYLPNFSDILHSIPSHLPTSRKGSAASESGPTPTAPKLSSNVFTATLFAGAFDSSSRKKRSREETAEEEEVSISEVPRLFPSEDCDSSVDSSGQQHRVFVKAKRFRTGEPSIAEASALLQFSRIGAQ